MSAKSQNYEVVVSSEFRLLLSDAEAVDIPVALKYAKNDPYAVCLSFGGDGISVQWVFGRELLMQGLAGAVGVGDVRVWPGARRGDDAIFVSLSSPDGQAVLQAKRSDISDFLNKTYDVVRPGTESKYVDVDAGLSQLLA